MDKAKQMNGMNEPGNQEAKRAARDMQTRGYSFPVRLLSAQRAGELAAMLSATGPEQRPMTSLQKRNPHFLFQPFWDLVTAPEIAELVRHILGPDAICFATSIIDKPADRTSHVAWHQDATYWGMAGRQAITIWLALTESTVENGAVRVVPGRQGTLLDHETCRNAHNMLGLNEELATTPDETRAVDMVLLPGEASIHDSLTIHGSLPNRSATQRTGFSMRFVSAGRHDAGAMLEGLICAPCVGTNGTAATLAPAPDCQTPDDAKANHRESVRRLGLHLARSKQVYHRERRAG
ncbi:MAG: hypothetical protein EP335_05700 [Alphaproteobacteria bacterium]|nr:MAG: hypothetical protein EP335_05700 [Alphaproteobacteria bacterium]